MVAFVKYEIYIQFNLQQIDLFVIAYFTQFVLILSSWEVCDQEIAKSTLYSRKYVLL